MTGHLLGAAGAIESIICVKAMQDIVSYVSANETRYGRNELKYVRTVDVSILRKQADTCAKQYRELDMKIQSLNWTVDLID